MILECLTCHGIYTDEQAGVRYFHVCPPLSRAELAAAVDAGRVKLPIDPVSGQAETVDQALARRSYERAHARDERPDLAQLRGDGTHPIRAAGNGAQHRPDLELLVAAVVVDAEDLLPAPPGAV